MLATYMHTFLICFPFLSFVLHLKVLRSPEKSHDHMDSIQYHMTGHMICHVSALWLDEPNPEDPVSQAPVSL